MKPILPNSNVGIRLSVMKNFMQFMEEAILQGYTICFIYNSPGVIRYEGHLYAAEEVVVDGLYCFDGECADDDCANLYLLNTQDGLKGTLVQVYKLDEYDEEAIFTALDHHLNWQH